MAQINKPTDYFESKTYTGTTADQNITGLSFQPDLAWFKVRSQAGSHRVQDSIRGTTKALFTNATDADTTVSNLITSFNSDGYTLYGAGAINENGQTYVSWNWLAGGTASSNTDGDITSNVSVNQTSGFSIVTYNSGSLGSAQTIGHGLGTTPAMIVFKNRDGLESWTLDHQGFGTVGTHSLPLNSTSAVATVSWGGNANSSTFTINSTVASTNSNYVAYCWSEKKGFSKFGSYTGNGSTDGTFIYTGFKPALFIVKNTTASGYNWEIRDNKRDSYNAVGYRLEPNTTNAEASYYAEYDFVSNGIKIRQNGNNYNTSGSTYIYMAFAENPLVGTNNVPACAR
jgi:hypothetical protein